MQLSEKLNPKKKDESESNTEYPDSGIEEIQ